MITKGEIMKKYSIRLTDEQRLELNRRFAGPLTLRPRNRIQVLLKSDAGETDEEIADDLHITPQTVLNIRRRFIHEGLDSALKEKPRSGGPTKLDDKAKMVLIGLACSQAPEGHTHWTARLLANRMIELQIVESVSEDTILRVLKKVNSNRGKKGTGAFPKA